MDTDKIEILEHTADLAVRINAEDEKELYELGAAAVYRLIGRPVPSESEPESHTISLQANDREDLFHDWLAEVLYWVQVRKVLFERFSFELLGPARVNATVWGRKLDVEKSDIHIEIKAVTYHNLHVEPKPDGKFTATVIFDI